MADFIWAFSEIKLHLNAHRRRCERALTDYAEVFILS